MRSVQEAMLRGSRDGVASLLAFLLDSLDGGSQANLHGYAGKGEALAFMKGRSFYAHSVSDVIRDELRRQGQDETR